MTRTALQRLFLAVVAVLSLGSMAEAAGPKKVVHPRPRHSTRVASGMTAKKKTTRSKILTRSRTTAPTRKPTTKPR
jgi:hypothetical protein